jgi:hypothetical protein
VINLGATIVILLIAIDLFIYFGIGYLIESGKTASRITEAQRVLKESRMHMPIGAGASLGDVASQSLLTIFQRDKTSAPLSRFLRLSIGIAFSIVQTGREEVDEAIAEIRQYAGFVAIYFLITVADLIVKLVEKGILSVESLVETIGAAPAQHIEIPAIVLTGILVFRLHAELKRLGLLLKHVSYY